MTAHADDLACVLDAVGADAVTVVGHSMGGFVACVLADQHAERVRNLVLLDGGLPLDVPAGLDADQVIAMVLGPTAERLAMEFADTDAYLGFWRRHPAFADAWSRGLRTVDPLTTTLRAPSVQAMPFRPVPSMTMPEMTGSRRPCCCNRLSRRPRPM